MKGATRNLLPQLIAVFVCLASMSNWAQVAVAQSDDSNQAPDAEDRMVMSPVVSGQAYSVGSESGGRENSLQYGVTFSTAYSDNVLGLSNGSPVSDINYSVWPTIGIDQGTARFRWNLKYAPGFTFYQRTSQRNETDHNATIGFEYRLSQHVTFVAADTFQKSSSVFNQQGLASGPVYGGTQSPNDSIIAPIANQLRNFGNVALGYQYSANDMIGAGGGFSNLYYPDKAQVNGLWDSSSQSGSAFYTHRFSSRHYVGAMYQYQRLMSYPGDLTAETQTQSAYLFYSVFPSERFSISFFGGPQHSNTAQPAIASLGYPAVSLRRWDPAGGTSLNWQGHFIGAGLSYSHLINSGGGLVGAVRLDTAAASVHFQLTRALSASVSGSYSNNNVIGYAVGASNGHTNEGTAALKRLVGEHFSVEIGYSRLHQTYDIPVISGAPNTNREFVSISYMFARPLGR